MLHTSTCCSTNSSFWAKISNQMRFDLRCKFCLFSESAQISLASFEKILVISPGFEEAGDETLCQTVFEGRDA